MLALAVMDRACGQEGLWEVNLKRLLEVHRLEEYIEYLNSAVDLRQLGIGVGLIRKCALFVRL